MSINAALTRRAALQAIGCAASCGAAAGARAQTYKPQAQTQISQAAAHYQSEPRGNESCGSCPYFIAPNKCVPVEGEISANGWCPMYTAFSPLDRGAHTAGQPGK
jgi:hypothetical protein